MPDFWVKSFAGDHIRHTRNWVIALSNPIWKRFSPHYRDHDVTSMVKDCSQAHKYKFPFTAHPIAWIEKFPKSPEPAAVWNDDKTEDQCQRSRQQVTKGLPVTINAPQVIVSHSNQISQMGGFLCSYFSILYFSRLEADADAENFKTSIETMNTRC